MHKLAALPGGWNPNVEGVVFIEQNPAPIIFITSADTDIQTTAAALSLLQTAQTPHFEGEKASLPDDYASPYPSDYASAYLSHRNFAEVRVANLLNLQQQASIDFYVDTVLSKARIIILRLLGGSSYWTYGLEAVKEIARLHDIALFVLPGDDTPDLDLISHSTVSLTAVNRLWRYLVEGGSQNYLNALKFASDLGLHTSYNPPQPKPVPNLGLYTGDWQSILSESPQFTSAVGILFYRSHYLAGNTLPIDYLVKALLARNIRPIPIFIASLRKPEIQSELLTLLQQKSVGLLLNTTSFSLAKIDDAAQTKFWQRLNLPVLQVIFSSSSKEQWQASWQGLTPRDVAMNVALPEVDGRIITRAVSFKSVQTWNERLETNVVVYQPQSDRIEYVAELAVNWLRLRQTDNRKKKIAVILANYPNKDGRIANGVGLDTPASCIEILNALQQAEYSIKDIPTTGEELIRRLTVGITNDPESQNRLVNQSLSTAEYQKYWQSLPPEVQQAISNRWGNNLTQSKIPISGIQLGNIFIGIQPSRGYDRDPSLNYHAPDLEPTHEYLAFYYWLRTKFAAQAIVHVGKHGNLEWLPGKSLALSANCYPEIALQTIPNIYPFIVNDPGEGSQAKRRSQAVIIDHLTPPLTRAELYGGLVKLEALIDEYYEAQSLDPSRLEIISDRITDLVREENLDKDLGIATINSQSIIEFLTLADGYLCELKEAQIRDGLHIFGKCPQGTQLRDLTVAIARCPSFDRLGIIQALAKDLNLNFDPLVDRDIIPIDSLQTLESLNSLLVSFQLGRLSKSANTYDIIEALEQIAAKLIENIISNKPLSITNSNFPNTYQQLQWIANTLLPNLRKSDREIFNLIKALDGEYVPSGASGAPTRGRPEVLPTGRNFYSVDIRGIPTETAWDMGRKAAEAVIERYTQEHGEYPQTLAISIWGTSTMRTGGDDIAQVMALMGVQPVWDGLSRRVVDFEILDEAVLERPRVDVTVRVSGFFRDSFPNLIHLLNKITQAVANLPESASINPLAEGVRAESRLWQQQGLDEDTAFTKASYRVFGSKPGAYGAGLQGLIEAQNWQSEDDLARAYLNWSAYAYDGSGKGYAAAESFERRLKQLQVVLHNQDNREHDLLDSDDYYQFQGGLTAAVRSLSGKNPEVYFGDNSIPANPRVRKLSEEIARVYRSRVINPKWLQGVMRHGYKGAFEMAATVDYLFAYDATTKCVPDHMYRGIAETYILDEKIQHFVRDNNPWALRDMAERLLEANQRNMWSNATPKMLEELKVIVNSAEGIIEEI
ncbi:cobaltochelatase subunit CobN [Myxosarcina sp. GI1]|uniref:cobaltochelatase subunit CobN n=1 Tax=Myxosarcina sp. GI1 TaxID=1541065 RepID=UPI00055A13AB|nr:cobaltochelatase subunit CobN [Myxosarcina sp. GI1]